MKGTGSSSSHASIIQCRDVTKDFITDGNIKHVISGIDLDVRENEFVVLFGPGQCGKTTFLNILSGLEPATTGTVHVDGKLVEGPGPDRGVVYQNVALFPWLTTRGNVEYGPKVRGVDKTERKRRAQYYIDLVGLQGFENSFPVKLSGGMKQRVGIARAYCNEPLVLFMDEPFGSLDAQTRYLMQEELEKIWERERRTIVFVTNNIEEAVYLADRIVLLHNCPTSVKQEYKIDLPRPRDYLDPEFLRLRKLIAGAMDATL
jgi:NitT/TauT family transport system ATP-binding protein/sulfonate transport system ATP-binding protein